MPKKTLFILISLLLISPALVPVFSIFTADETRVCGIDNTNYPSTREAEKSGIEVSYNFPCEFPKSEDSLFERTEDFEFTGMLLDFFNDTDKTQLFIRDNFDKQEYLVLSTTSSNKYLPGDQIKISGQINKNTRVIMASTINNLSAKDLIVFDCFLKDIDKVNSTIDCRESDTTHTFNFKDDARLVAGLKNPASLEDLQINDEMRVRIDEFGNIKIGITKKRGNTDFFVNNINILKGVIREINTSENYLILDSDDSLIKLNINPDTLLVQKYFGKLSFSILNIGDDLYIVAKKVNNDFSAITIKNNSIWK